jgi:hypothetical protein
MTRSKILTIAALVLLLPITNIADPARSVVIDAEANIAITRTVVTSASWGRIAGRLERL